MVDPENNFLFSDETMAELTVPKMMFRRIQKRDGTIVDFAKTKITNAIFAAAQSVGGKDYELADSLADRVILYLARTYEDGLLNVEQVQDAIEKVLIENGHARTVKSFILYRAERNRVRQHNLREKQPGAEPADISVFPKDLQVRTSHEEVISWNRQRIIEALIRETQLDAGIAGQISKEVEEQIIYSKIRVITAELIRELVNAKLIEYGFEKEQRRHTRLGIPLYDFEQLLFSTRAKAKNPVEKSISNSIYRQYALAKVFSGDIIEAHMQGDIYLHQLDEITKGYLLRIVDLNDFDQLKTILSQNIFSSYQININLDKNYRSISDTIISKLLNDRIEWNVLISESGLTEEIINFLLTLAQQTNLGVHLIKNPVFSTSELVVHKITLNLPRIAYLAAQQKNEIYLFQLLNARLQTIVQAHLQKQVLMNRIYETRFVELVKESGSFVSEPTILYSIGIIGLNELVQAFSGSQLHQTEAAQRFGIKLLSYLQEQCRLFSKSVNIPLVLEPSYNADVSARFSKLDLSRFHPFASLVIKKKPTNGGGYYTLGANLADTAEIALFHRIETEARFHSYLNKQGYVSVPISSHITEPTHSGTDRFFPFLKKIFNETNCQYLFIKK